MTDQRAAWLDIMRKHGLLEWESAETEFRRGDRETREGLREFKRLRDKTLDAIAEAVAAHESKAERKLAEIEKLCQEYSLVPRDHILDVLSNEP